MKEEKKLDKKKAKQRQPDERAHTKVTHIKQNEIINIWMV